MNGFKKFVVYVMAVLALTFVMPNWNNGTEVEAKAKKVRLNYKKITIQVGKTKKLKVKGTSKKIKWKSSNKKIATVSKKGKVKGKKAGKCTITARVNKKKLKCKVTVKAKKSSPDNFTDTTLSVSSLEMNIYDTAYNEDGKLLITDTKSTYKLSLLNTSESTVWSSSDNSVATVDNGIITAVGKGSCTITAVAKNTSYKCSVVITDLDAAEEIVKQKSIYEMLGLINQDRVKAKVAPLKIKKELNKVADIRAKEIAKGKNFKNFSHTRPDGTDYSTAYADAGFKKGSKTGENLGYYKAEVEYIPIFVKEAYNVIYKEKAHKEVMLSPKYEYIGIGYADTGAKIGNLDQFFLETFWVQELYTK